MLPAMSQQTRVTLLASLFTLSLALTGCDMLGGKKDDADAAAVAPVATPTTPAATTAAPGAPTPVETSAPLGATPGQPAVAPAQPGAPATAKPADAGAVAVTDGGVKTDAAAPAATPTPTFAIPTAIPGFDAGGFKPPAGFPSTIPTTLPTFPPPQK